MRSGEREGGERWVGKGGKKVRGEKRGERKCKCNEGKIK